VVVLRVQLYQEAVA